LDVNLRRPYSQELQALSKYNQLTFLALEPMTDRIFCGH